MANERQRRLMQEALDERLTPEARRELLEQLDAEATAQFNRLRHIDSMLRSAPFEHAPQRLAAAILARVAETLKAEHLPRTTGLALALALALVTLLLLPLLIAAGWLALAALGSAAAMSAVLQQIVMVLAMIVGALAVLIERAQVLVAESPQTPALLLALIPIALYGVMRYMSNRDSEAV